MYALARKSGQSSEAHDATSPRAGPQLSLLPEDEKRRHDDGDLTHDSSQPKKKSTRKKRDASLPCVGPQLSPEDENERDGASVNENSDLEPMSTGDPATGEDTETQPETLVVTSPVHAESDPQLARRESEPDQPLAVATAVDEDEEMPSATSSGGGAIAIATAKTSWLDFKSKRVRWCIAIAILISLGAIAGTAYGFVSKTSPPPALPFTPLPPSPTIEAEAPTSAPGPLVWQQVGQSLVEEGDPPATGSRGELYFGWSVDLSKDGHRLAATSPFVSAVDIYDLVDGTWMRTAEIVDEDGDFVDHIAISSDGLVLAVGTPGSDNIVLYGGKVQVYENLSGSSWQKRGEPIFGISPGDRIGGFIDDDSLWDTANHTRDEIFSTESYDSSSLSLSHNGTILAIGSSVGNYAQVFRYDAVVKDWTLFGNNNVFAGENDNDKFGTSVDLSSDGTRIVIGAPKNIGKADATFTIYNGHVRVFQYVQEFGGWVQVGRDIDGDRGEEYAGEQAGSSVSISEDGSTISVAANLQASSEDVYALGDSDGHVKIFQFEHDRADDWVQVGNTINVYQFGLSETTWEEIEQLVVGLGSEKFPIVARLSGDGNRVAVSVLSESLTDVLGRGVVRLYELRGEVWEIVADPIEGSSPFDHSGRSIALSFDGMRLAVGSPRHNTERPDEGQVWIFDLDQVLPSSPPTSVPSAAAPNSQQPLVPITIFLMVDARSGVSWSVQCGSEILSNRTTPPGPINVTETVFVPDGEVCRLQKEAQDWDWRVNGIIIRYGEDSTTPIIVIRGEPTRDTIVFAASPDTAASTIFLQYDAHPEETSWRLFCDGHLYAQTFLVGYTGPFDFRQETVYGIREGASCEFIITDSFGNGICCEEGRGFYRLSYGDDATGVILADGGNFGSEESRTFQVSNKGISSTVAPPQQLTALTIVLQVTGGAWDIQWYLLCDGKLITIVPKGTYASSVNTTVALSVEDGASCLLTVSDNCCRPNAERLFEVYIGQTIDSVAPSIKLVAFGAETEAEQVAFVVEAEEIVIINR